MSEQLLPCPFCGKSNVSTFGPYGWYRRFGISHSCASFYSGTSEMMQGFARESDAIAAWNGRTGGWQPIETAPKDGCSLLLAIRSTSENSTYGDGGNTYVMQGSFEDGIWMTLDCSGLENRCWAVTHWMPLPTPPQAAS